MEILDRKNRPTGRLIIKAETLLNATLFSTENGKYYDRATAFNKTSVNSRLALLSNRKCTMVTGVYRKLWDGRGRTQHKEAGQADDDDDDDEDDDEDDEE